MYVNETAQSLSKKGNKRKKINCHVKTRDNLLVENVRDVIYTRVIVAVNIPTYVSIKIKKYKKNVWRREIEREHITIQ